MFFGKIKGVLHRAKAGLDHAVRRGSELISNVGAGYGVAKDAYRAIQPHLGAFIGQDAAKAVDSAVGRGMGLVEQAQDRVQELRGQAEGKLKDLAMRGADIMTNLPPQAKSGLSAIM